MTGVRIVRRPDRPGEHPEWSGADRWPLPVQLLILAALLILSAAVVVLAARALAQLAGMDW